MATGKPKRVSNAAYGMIKHRFNGQDEYLLQLNPGWNHRFNFISGHIEPADQNDYQNTIIREVEEELFPIRYRKEFTIEPITAEPFRESARSLSAGVETDYTFFLFMIFFCAPPDRLSFLWQGAQSVNHWFTEDELRRGSGRNGERITRFPVPALIRFLPDGFKGLPDSFTGVPG